MYTIICGRPANFKERQPEEQKTYELLDQLSIPYWYIDHKPMATIADCADVDKALQIEICKNLFLCNEKKTNFYLLLLPGNKKFKAKELSKLLSVSHLSFASPEYMKEYLHLSPGSVTIMGMIYDTNHAVTLVIDKDVMKQEYFACHPCINTTSIKLRTKDLLEKFLPALSCEPVFVDLPYEQEA